jgi:hypothetical protein
MMAKAPCNLTIVEIREYNIDLDADAYPLIAISPLVMSGRDEHNDFSIYTCSGSMETKLTNGRLQLKTWLAHET